MTHRHRNVYVILPAAWVVVAVLSLALGTTGVSVSDYWRQASASQGPFKEFMKLLAELPLPRLAIGTLAGASLAMAGAMFQSMFRNPLASPYTLGVSSGASLGAAIVIMSVGGGLWYGLPMVGVAAFAGALICVTIVYLVASLRQDQSIGTLLLAGITIGFICSALIVSALFLAERHDMSAILQWMMGSLQVVGFEPVYESLAMAALASGVAIYLHRDLDLLMMGEIVAASRGVSVRRSRFLIYFAASLLTAAIVAHCGPIGFVGLMVPHIARFLVGPTHRHLLPASALVGAVFLPFCDLLARNAMWWLQGGSRQLPVGVLTNLVGGCFFLYLLLTRRNDRPIG